MLFLKLTARPLVLGPVLLPKRAFASTVFSWQSKSVARLSQEAKARGLSVYVRNPSVLSPTPTLLIEKAIEQCSLRGWNGSIIAFTRLELGIYQVLHQEDLSRLNQ